MQFFLPAPCKLHGSHNTGIHISAKGFQGFLHTINNVSVDFVRDKLLNFVKNNLFMKNNQALPCADILANNNQRT